MALVSIYPHIKEVKQSETMSLIDIVDLMREGAWKEKIEPLRELVRNNAPTKELDKAKSKLPYFTASGVFKHREDEGLIQHSGKLAIDFDKIPEDDRTRVWDILVNDKYSEYVFRSCTGRGFCVITDIDADKHLESFQFLQKHYKKHYSIHATNEKDDKGKFLPHNYLDPACKDLSRPRYISYDENLFHNPNYEHVRIPANSIGGATATVDDDEEKFEWVKTVMNKKESFVEGNRHNYLVIMGYFLNKVGVSSEYTSDRFYRDYGSDLADDKEMARILRDTYKPTEQHGTFTINKKLKDLPPEFADNTKKVYAHAYGMNEEGRTWGEGEVLALCAQYLLAPEIVRSILSYVYDNNKDSFNIKNKPEIFKVEVFIRKRYELVRNEVSQRIEARVKGSEETDFQKINVDNIARDLMHADMKFPLDKLKSLLRSDFVPRYNPFYDYFYGLPDWDENEEPDYISELADYVQTDNQEFWKVQFKKALVRSLACSLDHKENRIVPTLVQNAQESGKSNFIKFLCPPILKDYYTDTLMVAGTTDSDLQLSENFIWNLEELETSNNNEINKLKAVISRSKVKQRRAYAEFHESNPRRVNFWASTNKREFLTDDQNTRWLCFNVISINHDYGNWRTGISKVNINNVWAQAMSLYKAGFDFNLTAEEKEERDTLNKEYELSSMEKDLIISLYEVAPEPGLPYTFVTKTDVYMKIQQATDYKYKPNEYNVRRALKQLGHCEGFKKVNNKTVRGYWVKEQANSLPGTKTPLQTGEIEDKQKPF